MDHFVSVRWEFFDSLPLQAYSYEMSIGTCTFLRAVELLIEQADAIRYPTGTLP